MEVPRGHGFLGVIMYDDANNLCQCHVCGKWFRSVGQHANMKHQLQADDYKIKYGMTLKAPLCGIDLSRTKSKNSRLAYERGELAIDKLTAQNRKRVKFQRPRQSGIASLQKQNEHGLCSLQIRARYEVLKKVVGRDPSYGDYLKHDHRLLQSGIRPRHGNLNNFRKFIKERPKQSVDFTRLPDIDLIASLRRARVLNHGKTPSSQDARKHRKILKLRNVKTYYRHFGSWNGALSAAGLA